MLDVLRILLCGAGAVYLVIRLRSLLRSLAGGHLLWPLGYEPADEPRRAARHKAVTPARERATVSSRRFSA